VEKALSANGLTLHANNKRHSSMTDEEGYLGMEALLSRPEKPTAILCASTALALGAIRSVNQRGLKPGRDISLIAHDDVLPLLKPDNFSVPLTTTRSSLRAAGVRVGQRLINRIKLNQTEPHQELWKAELVVRASTGPAPKA
jgi:LacI family transcriptional regulator